MCDSTKQNTTSDPDLQNAIDEHSRVFRNSMLGSLALLIVMILGVVVLNTV